jgi:hypothetical protein
MRSKVEVDAASGLVVFADSGLSLTPPALAAPDFTRYFRDLANQKKLFYLDGEDPSKFRLLICVDEPLSDLPKHRFQQLSGAFALPVPSGRLIVSTQAQPENDTELPVPPGTYAVSVLGVGPGEIDGAAFKAERFKVLGDKNHRYREWVDWLGVAGIIPFGFALIVVLVYQFSLVSLLAIAVGIAALLPRWLISRTPWYRQTERRLNELEASFPNFVLDLRKVDSVAGVVGGHFVVP